MESGILNLAQQAKAHRKSFNQAKTTSSPAFLGQTRTLCFQIPYSHKSLPIILSQISSQMGGPMSIIQAISPTKSTIQSRIPLDHKFCELKMKSIPLSWKSLNVSGENDSRSPSGLNRCASKPRSPKYRRRSSWSAAGIALVEAQPEDRW